MYMGAYYNQFKFGFIIIASYKEMKSYEDPKNYQYTFYNSKSHTNTSSLSSNVHSNWDHEPKAPTTEQHFTTSHTVTLHNLLPEPVTSRIEPILQEEPYEAPKSKLGRSRAEDEPLTFPCIDA
jgi:hypothetical protein